jgi:hypothetical protein
VFNAQKVHGTVDSYPYSYAIPTKITKIIHKTKPKLIILGIRDMPSPIEDHIFVFFLKSFR